MKGNSIKFTLQLGFVGLCIPLLLIWLGGLYQAEAAPPEPAERPSGTPTAATAELIIVEEVAATLPSPTAARAKTGPFAVITNQGFEGSWPAAGWELVDQSDADGGTYRWGKRNCHPRTGSFAGWSVGGGTQGSNLSCSDNYPNNIDTWAVYGPFDLSDADAANLTYYLWGKTELASQCQYDRLAVMSSINGINFSGHALCGDFTNGTAGNGYHEDTLDLANRLGQSQVWIAFRFISDNIITHNGITIDDITLDVDNLPDPPNTLTASGISQTQINLTWQDNSNNETGFKIERSPNGVSNWIEIVQVGANAESYTNTGLTCGTTYHYKVRAYNGDGFSTYSNVDDGATQPCPTPTPPSNLTATAVSTSQINLAWQDNSNNETGFKIYRSLNGVSWGFIGSVSANVTSYANTGLACETTYYYQVKAYNGSGDSNPSNTANATTFDCPPVAPSNLTATAVSTSQINLNWQDNSNNETSFEVEWSPDGVNWLSLANVEANITGYNHTGLIPETLYYYQVRARNAAGTSNPSNQANAITLPEEIPPSFTTYLPIIIR